MIVRQRVAARAIVTSTIPLTLASFHRELIRQLQAAGYKVTVVSSPGEHLQVLESELGVATTPVPMAREIDPLGDAAALRRWLAICRKVRPELVIAATPKASLLAMVAARATGVPKRLYYLGGLRLEGEVGRRRTLLAAMERLTGAAATVVVANSPSLVARARELRLFAPHKLHSTRPGSSHGVDTTYFAPREPDAALRVRLGLDPDRPVLGFVGRLTHDKGIDTLLAALRLLGERGVDAQLLVVGSQIEPDSRRYVDLLTSTGSVVFAGNQTDVRPYYALMNVHVLPSLREGFPNVVLEASAMGTPTVTTDATGCIDSVRPGETGLVVPARDAAALAGSIGRLLPDQDARERMGAAAREWVAEAFVPERVVASILEPVLPTRATGLTPPPIAVRPTAAARPRPLVTVTPYGPGGASSRVRVFDWLDHTGMEAERHTYRGASDNRPRSLARDPRGTIAAELAVRRLDVRGETVLISREASPFSDGSVEERLLRSADHGVYDFDDALFHHTTGARRLLRRADACRRAASAADVVIAGNDYLAEWASRYHRDVRVIPSCVEPSTYVVKHDYEISDPPRLVWLGSPSTETYLVDIAPALRQIHRRTGARLSVISGPGPNPSLAPIVDMLDRVPWTHKTFATHLAGADLALGPLADTEWARGKCPYKPLQYAAAGLPMIASPVGANRLALQRFNGVCVEATTDWADAVCALIEAPAAHRAARGHTARAGVQEHYSFDAWTLVWRTALGTAPMPQAHARPLLNR